MENGRAPGCVWYSNAKNYQPCLLLPCPCITSTSCTGMMTAHPSTLSQMCAYMCAVCRALTLQHVSADSETASALWGTLSELRRAAGVLAVMPPAPGGQRGLLHDRHRMYMVECTLEFWAC